jgi:hypothetical protein
MTTITIRIAPRTDSSVALASLLIGGREASVYCIPVSRLESMRCHDDISPEPLAARAVSPRRDSRLHPSERRSFNALSFRKCGAVDLIFIEPAGHIVKGGNIPVICVHIRLVRRKLKVVFRPRSRLCPNRRGYRLRPHI